MFKGFIDGREFERCVLSGRRFADGIEAAVDGVRSGFAAGAASVWCRERSEASFRAAMAVTGGRTLALAMMQAGMEAAVPLRKFTRMTCADRCANMSAFRMRRSSFLSWARTASRS